MARSGVLGASRLDRRIFLDRSSGCDDEHFFLFHLIPSEP